MNKNLLLLLLLLPLIISISTTCAKNEIQNKKNLNRKSIVILELSPFPRKKRRHDYHMKYEMKRISKGLKMFTDLQQKIREEKEKEKNKRKNKEEMKRRKAYDKYLMPSHSGTSFLRDFHTGRF